MFETIKRSKLSLAVGAGLIMAGAAVASTNGAQQSDRHPLATAATYTAPRPGAVDSVYPASAFVELAARVGPAVVRIEVTQARDAGQQPQARMPEQFRRFFREPGADGRSEQAPPVMGGGTGFVISRDGYIVTNEHVVGDADDIVVTLRDRRSFPAELVGTDPTTDLAVIKVDVDDLPTVPFGSSADLQVGEWIMAVGNPGFGGGGMLDHTVTTGIVSAKKRPLSIIGRSLQQDPEYGSQYAGYAIENFIQTDAVINPGNSGGPMVNLRGEVVGVNSAIASTSGYYQGYGFAIPSDLAGKVASDLIAFGHVKRAWLGVSVEGITPEDVEVFGLPAVQGVLVQAITDDGPADDAGVRRGDVIYAVDGVVVDRGGHLQQLIAEKPQDATIDLTVYRDGDVEMLTVKLGAVPMREKGKPEVERTDTTNSKLGLGIANLTDDLASRFGYDSAGGVVITEVTPWGPAGRRGIQAGMKIAEVNGEAAKTARELTGLLADMETGDVVSLELETPNGDRRIANLRVR